ncbi:uncharacterized protein LOC118434020 [Folsomia candida]|nr:uncharacterized protein LOC118434020 [Folsomia candida]
MILVKMLSELPLLKTELSRATSDTDLYYARNNIDRLRRKVIEAERIKQDLDQELNQLDEKQEYDSTQKEMWSNLSKFLNVKVSVLKEKREERLHLSDVSNLSGRQYFEAQDLYATGSGTR